MSALTLGSFLLFTGLVAFFTWLITRRDDHTTNTGYFLAGRSLTFPLIAGSLLLTNLSTEQLIGLNGDAYRDGLCVMVWEVVAVFALVAMALFFLPRFLRSGVATVPEFLELRYDRATQVLTNIIFLVAYMAILLPMILYTGAAGLLEMLEVDRLLGITDPSASPAWLSHVGDWASGITNRDVALYVIVIIVGTIGSIYALFGGLRTVAVSDTLNGIGLLTGGFLITGYALSNLGGDAGMVAGAERLYEEQADRFNSIGGSDSSVPFGSIFSGIFLLNLFYWTTNQQIIQRTFGASSLAEGQKGVLLTGLLKLLGPLYLVLPGMLAFSILGDDLDSKQAYGRLVNHVLPDPLTGFFAAVVVGAILSSFNSALNSSCTLFSLGLYKTLRPNASEHATVRSGKWFGWIVAILSMATAPLLDQAESIFGYLQKMNAIYFIPIFAVTLIGMVTRRVPASAAKVALLVGIAAILIGYFVPPFNAIVDSMHTFYFLGTVFAWLIVIMLLIGATWPRETEWIQQDVGAVDMTPWRGAQWAGLSLLVAVVAIYLTFADFSVLQPR